jgi:hypothetical protein
VEEKLYMASGPNYYVSNCWMIEVYFFIDIILRPGIYNSISGFITTLVNIYTARHGDWSITAIITATITGICTTTLLILLGVYNFWKLDLVKKEHKKRMDELQGSTTTGSAS